MTVRKSILKRVRNAEKEMLRQGEFHHLIVNDVLDDAYARLQKLVHAQLREGQPVPRSPVGNGT